MYPLHHATQRHARDLGVLGLRWVQCRDRVAGRQIEVVEGGQNDALHDALVTGKASFTRQELAALRITPDLREDMYIRVGKGSGVGATTTWRPQTPIACLIETYKPMCGTKDGNGMLPLHYAARNGAEELVIRLLLEAHRDAARVLSFSSRLPLHWGAEGQLEAAALKLLIEAYPQALELEDAGGCKPRDLAASNVKSLLK